MNKNDQAFLVQKIRTQYTEKEHTCLDELKIDPATSTDDWYAVCTVTGIEGFCMKKFVAVRQ